MDLREVVLGADAFLDREEAIGDLHAPALARRALTARLDGEEPAQLPGHAGHVGRVVVDDETRGAEAGADRLHVLVGERHVEVICGDHRVRDAGQRRDEMPVRVRPSGCFEHRPKRSAQLDLEDTAADDIPDEGHDHGAW